MVMDTRIRDTLFAMNQLLFYGIIRKYLEKKINSKLTDQQFCLQIHFLKNDILKEYHSIIKNPEEHEEFLDNVTDEDLIVIWMVIIQILLNYLSS
jgi:hypothetical protein